MPGPKPEALSDLDHTRLREALDLAQGSIGLSEPNPRVGCVIGFSDGRIVGRGCTQEPGGPHAEVAAMRDAAARGLDLRGATVWVTLEPCAHHGRTPPCCDALVAAGVARVVVAVGDPFPLVAGRGIARLRAAGIAVDIADGPIRDEARALNVGFFSRVERGRPWVRLKVAVSLDGRTALADGRSQWITGVAARADGHAWRHRAGAVMTGIGTVLADDPALDVRLVPARRQPLRVVLDRRWRTPPGSRLLAGGGPVLVVGATEDRGRQAALVQVGATTIALPGEADGATWIRRVLDLLGERAVNELHVEAGPTLNGALLEAGCVDELLVYLAPRLLGPGQPLATLTVLPDLARPPAFEFHDVQSVGPDLRLRLLARMHDATLVTS